MHCKQKHWGELYLSWCCVSLYINHSHSIQFKIFFLTNKEMEREGRGGVARSVLFICEITLKNWLQTFYDMNFLNDRTISYLDNFKQTTLFRYLHFVLFGCFYQKRKTWLIMYSTPQHTQHGTIQYILIYFTPNTPYFFTP